MARIMDMQPLETKARIESGDAVLIDVREPFEHASEHIPGSETACLSSFDREAVQRLAGDRTPIFYCRSGKRSAEAASKYANNGTSVLHLHGGINAWKDAGLPVERSARAPKIDVIRQVHMTAGSLVVLGVALGYFVHPAWLGLSAFVGCGLVFAGASGWCGMAKLLAQMPWNKV
ncbi:MAG: rhodanese-like domain-containing protein [Phycisphaerales bacterium]